jgi:hypothetical protein
VGADLPLETEKNVAGVSRWHLNARNRIGFEIRNLQKIKQEAIWE